MFYCVPELVVINMSVCVLLCMKWKQKGIWGILCNERNIHLKYLGEKIMVPGRPLQVLMII